MTAVVVEAGPVTVHAGGEVVSDLAAVAVADIDDELVLLDDQPVPVTRLWADVLTAAVAQARTLTLICPTWWTADRCARVRAAVPTSCTEVVVLQRSRALSAGLGDTGWVVVEIADRIVLVSSAEAEPVALARHDDADVDPEAVVRAVLAVAGPSTEVSVDAPAEVVGAVRLGRAVVAGLRRRGMVATMADRPSLRAMPTETPVLAPDGGRNRWGRRAIAAVAGVAAAGVLAGVSVTGGAPADPEMTVLVEGRVGMQIPAGWTVERITDGPGSARVQVVSSTDPQTMLHLTQSAVGDAPVADTVRRALRDQPAGVFVDFDPAAVVGGRQVVGYREVRAGREVGWAVFADGPVRIAIGCQGVSGRVCDTAVGSAHAVS